jgi:WD40 repeat protein/energy-coupling factor transporter ATP-binding protein EcfA2
MADAQGRFNPFPGLRPFKSEEDYLFFGREEHTNDLLRRLRQKRFMAVVGASGSGKSSLVHAGLMPALHGGFMTQSGSSWRVAVFRPGGDPIGELARALSQPDVFGADDEANAAVNQTIIETVLRRSTLGLVEIARQARMSEGENLLVVVDQFEELFRFKESVKGTRGTDDSAAFVKLLLEAGRIEMPPIYIVLTMRSDFLGDCARFRDLPEAINDGQFLIPRMTRDQRRKAIEGPVAVGGAKMSPRLAQRLLNDVGDSPDQLPILQHALMRTWDKWREDGDEQLDIPHYEITGGMGKALSRHADEVYAELPDDRSRTVAEKLFKALTDKGPDNRGLRRPTRLDELCRIISAEEGEVVAVIEAFRQPGCSFLMPLAGVPLQSDSVVDISHESLMRIWDRLRTWVEEEARSAQIYRRLAETAVLHKTGDAGLWRDPDLQLALEWRGQSQPNEAWAKRYHPAFAQSMGFLEDSRKEREAEQAREEERRRRELEQAQALAAARAKAARRLLMFSIGLAVVALLAVGTAIFALSQRQQAVVAKGQADRQRQVAQEQAKMAEERRVEAEKAKESEQQQRQVAQEQARIAKSERQRAVESKEEADRQRQFAQEQARRRSFASARELAIAANENLYKDPELSVLLAMQAVKETYDVDESVTREAFAALHRAEWASRVRLTLTGHSVSVFDVSFSPDGKRLATGSRDNTAKVWDVESGDEILTLTGHTDEVSGVSFSPDGKRLATGSRDNTAKVWDVESGDEIFTLTGHKDDVLGVSFSPDGKRLATCSYDNTAKVWDVESGDEILILTGHKEAVWGVSFSPDGKYLATCSRDNTAEVWDMESGDEILILTGHKEEVLGVSFSPDGKYLATGSTDSTAKVWDVESGDEILTLAGHSGSVFDVSFSPNGKRLATGSWDYTAGVWDVKSGDEILTLTGHSGSVFGVSFSPDGKYLATGSSDNTAKVWDVESGDEILTLTGHNDSVLAISFSPDGRYLAIGSVDNTAGVWDVESGDEILILTRHEYKVSSVSFSPDGKYLATGSGDNTAKVWDMESGQETLTLTGHRAEVSSVSFSPDGKYLATGSLDNTAKVWDIESGGEILNLTGHNSFVLGVSFSPDGKYLATGSVDNTAKVWDVESGEEILTLTGHKDYIEGVSFSPDGKYLATCSDDSTAKVWDMESDNEIYTLTGHSGAVSGVSFSPDGKYLATGSWDNTAKVWDVESGDEILTLTGHRDEVSSVSFSPDGKYLATGSWDGSARVFVFGIEALMETAPTRVSRTELTAEERRRYLHED